MAGNPDPPRRQPAVEFLERTLASRAPGRYDRPVPQPNGDVSVARAAGSPLGQPWNRSLSNTDGPGHKTGRSRTPRHSDRTDDVVAPPAPSSRGSEPLDIENTLSQTHDEETRAPPAWAIRSNRVALLTLPLVSLSVWINSLRKSPSSQELEPTGPWTLRSRVSWPSFKLPLPSQPHPLPAER